MKTVRVLHIDDDADDSYFLFDALSKVVDTPAYRFTTTASEAKCFLENGSFIPDVIFVDYYMPITNGIDFLLWIKQQPKLQEIPTIVLSTIEQQEVYDLAQAAGAQNFFLKPSDFNDWFNLVKSALASTKIARDTSTSV